MSWNRFSFAPYVPVGQRLFEGKETASALAKKEKRPPQPVQPQGREIAKSFWGKAWCEHLRSMHDLDNRLERGIRYLRNGSVVDLVMETCLVKSLVAGSSTYKVTMKVKPLSGSAWERIKKEARNSVRSAMDLLAGKLDESTIRVLTDPQKGIFPKPDEISFSCSCPDGAYVCKHVAAVFYGVGTLLDSRPELLFLIRDVDSSELIGLEAVAASLGESLAGKSSLGDLDLEEMFGIELEKEATPPTGRSLSQAKPKKSVSKDLRKAKAAKPKSSPGKTKSKKAPSPTPALAAKKDTKNTAPKPKPASIPSKSVKGKSGAQKSPAKPKMGLTEKPKVKSKPIKRSNKSEK